MSRLEAATSRLEDLADEQARKSSRVSITSVEHNLTSYAAPAPLSPPSAPALVPVSVSAPAAAVPRSVTAFDEIFIAEKFKPFVELTKSLGGPLVEQVSQCSIKGKRRANDLSYRR